MRMGSMSNSERQYLADVVTSEGVMPSWITHPAAAGAWPLLIFYMDAPGMRDELRSMALRLASAGYYVMLPNLYYRTDPVDMGAFRGDESATHKQLIGQLMDSLTLDMVMADTAALLDHARADRLRRAPGLPASVTA